MAFGVLEDACALEQGDERNAQGVGDGPQDGERGLVQPAFDLAQIGVGDRGPIRQVAQREPRGRALRADQGSQGQPRGFAHTAILSDPEGTCRKERSGAARRAPRDRGVGMVRRTDA